MRTISKAFAAAGLAAATIISGLGIGSVAEASTPVPPREPKPAFEFVTQGTDSTWLGVVRITHGMMYKSFPSAERARSASSPFSFDPKTRWIRDLDSGQCLEAGSKQPILGSCRAALTWSIDDAGYIHVDDINGWKNPYLIDGGGNFFFDPSPENAVRFADGFGWQAQTGAER